MREEFGINIASIRRGDIVINVPNRYEKLYPNDVVSLIGTDVQLIQFKNYLEDIINKSSLIKNQHEVLLQHFTVGAECFLAGKSISESGIRESTKGLVVGVERNEQRILNPESDFIFQVNDTIWMVADEKRMKVFVDRL